MGTDIIEFFRGSEADCRHIRERFGGGEADFVRTHPWHVIIGPSEDWDEFMR